MPIHNENTDHAFFTEGPSLCETEHAERCSIEYQLARVARGLPPNWGNNNIQYGYEKMDNSLTDHKIGLDKAVNDLLGSDLTDIPDETFSLLSPITQAMLNSEREKQKNAKKQKNANQTKPPASKQSAGSTLPDEKPSADSTNTQGSKS